ncbi:MAG: hypothetical protein MN733_00945 [Nitrososphaera sp.]|nr:hypothetical protein [Nitrososphaera sp.]
MTKKDYQLIADAILEARRGLAVSAVNPHIVKTWPVGDIFEHATFWVIRELSDTLQRENPGFDPERFKDACLKKLNG